MIFKMMMMMIILMIKMYKENNYNSTKNFDT